MELAGGCRGLETGLRSLRENQSSLPVINCWLKILLDISYEVFEKKLKTNPLTADEINLGR
jgi:hypothetical protein